MRTWLLVAMLVAVVGLVSQQAEAVTVLGTGAGALLGGDLTDPENDGQADADVGYNATFTSSEEPGFGGGEHAFNVFDNLVGGGNAKWCCGDNGGGTSLFPEAPIWITAELDIGGQFLTHFTVTSGNDTPARDPRVWEIQGSNDGINFTTLFAQSDVDAGLWTARSQVLRFDAGVDFDAPATAYQQFRFITSATGLETGARFQLAEIEYFGTPEPATLSLLGLGALALVRRRRRSQ